MRRKTVGALRDVWRLYFQIDRMTPDDTGHVCLFRKTTMQVLLRAATELSELTDRNDQLKSNLADLLR